jgi:PAS domain S-box-containing protein
MKKKNIAFQKCELCAHACPDNFDEAIISTTDAFEIKSWNKGAERIYGLTKEEVMGKRLIDVIQFAFIGESLHSFVTKLSYEEHWEGEMLYIGCDSVLKIPHVSIRTVNDNNGHVKGYVAFIYESAAAAHASNVLYKPVFNAEYKYVGLQFARLLSGWEVILHWQE